MAQKLRTFLRQFRRQTIASEICGTEFKELLNRNFQLIVGRALWAIDYGLARLQPITARRNRQIMDFMVLYLIETSYLQYPESDDFHHTFFQLFPLATFLKRFQTVA